MSIGSIIDDKADLAVFKALYPRFLPVRKSSKKSTALAIGGQ